VQTIEAAFLEPDRISTERFDFFHFALKRSWLQFVGQKAL
jgi:hypothetical protein